MGGFFQQANDAAIAQSARDSVALAATPPVATGGDAATIAGLIEVQAARAAQPAFDVLDSAMAAALGGTTPAVAMPMLSKADHDHSPMEVDANTLALYRLHESWDDLSGNGRDLTPTNGPTITPWGAEFSKADNSYAGNTGAFDFSGVAGVTIDFAGRHIGSLLGLERPINWTPNANNEIVLHVRPDSGFRLLSKVGGASVDKSYMPAGGIESVINDDFTLAIQIEINGAASRARLYLNGAVVIDHTFTADGFDAVAGGIRLGRSEFVWNGLISDVRISDVARYGESYTPADYGKAYVRNPDWLLAGVQGATAMCVACPTLTGNNIVYRKVVKLTPHVCMVAWHAKWVNQTYRWVTWDNQVYDIATAALPEGLTGYETSGNCLRIGSTDIGLYRITDLPAGWEDIDCLPIATAVTHATLATWTPRIDVPLMGLLGGATTHPNRVASPRRLSDAKTAKAWTDYDWFEMVASDDSGSLIGYLLDGKFAACIQVKYLGVGSAGGSSESLSSQIEAINQAIADLGYPDEQLTVVSLAGD